MTNCNLIKIEMWSNNWFILDFVLQCFNFFDKLFVMNIKSIMLHEFFVFHVTIFRDKIKFMFVFCIAFNNAFIATCCVNLKNPFQYEWCKLKLPNNNCSFSFYNCCFVINIVNELFVNEYDAKNELYTLWMLMKFDDLLFILITNEQKFVDE